MRLIDADAFKEYMRNALEETRGYYPDKGEWAETITEQFCEDIDDQPTIEPERKKGEWTDDNACPFCGFQPWYERDIHTLSYCPNCGAVMRGEKDETN